jgi:hypothetical protein
VRDCKSLARVKIGPRVRNQNTRSRVFRMNPMIRNAGFVMV